MMPKHFPVICPYKQSLIKELPFHTPTEIEGCINRGFALAQRLGSLPKPDRILILERSAQILHEQQEELAQLIALEGGKPLRDARVETQRAIQGIKTAIAALYQLHGQEVPMGFSTSSLHRIAFTRREPRGLVFAISAFNHPLNLIIHQVVPALAVGCPVLIKPSLKTPLSCIRFLDILRASGLPEGWCQLLLIDDAQTERLAADPRLATVSFIGSSRVGWKLRSQLAPGVHCLLEHGGTAPVVIAADADLDAMIESLARGAFYHAGQVCVSVQNIFVHQQVADSFLERFVQTVAHLRTGDPSDPATDIGPLIRPGEADRVQTWTAAAVAEGARVLIQGERRGASLLTPTILADASFHSHFFEDEMFGPAVGIYRYTELEAVIARLNTSRFAFQAAIFTQDMDRALRFAEGVHAAGILVNEHTAFRVDWMPFGGLKHSGQGVGGILPSMMELSYEKMLLLRSRGLLHC